MKYLQLLLGLLALCHNQLCADQLYVANQTSNTVSVVSTVTQNQVAVIDVFNNPFQVFATPDEQQVWVIQISEAQNAAQVIDPNTNQILTIINPLDSGSFTTVAFSPDSSLAYVVNQGADTIDVYSTADFSVVQRITSPLTNPFQIMITPDGSTGYLTNFSTSLGKIENIDTNSSTSTTFSGPIVMAGGAISPGGESIYLLSTTTNPISFVFGDLPITADSDLSQFTTDATSSAFSNIVFPPDTSSFYGGTVNRYYQVDTTDNSTIDEGFGPAATFIALGSKGRFIYSTAQQTPGSVKILDTTTNTDTGIQIAVQNSASGIVALADPETNFVARSLYNRSILQYEFYNRVSWTTPTPIEWTPKFYLIYRDQALTDLAYIEAASADNRVFNDQGRTRGVTYEYYLVAIDTDDVEHVLAMTSVTAIPPLNASEVELWQSL